MRDEQIAELAQQLANQWQEALAVAQTQLAETVGGVLLRGARAVQFGNPTPVVSTTGGDLMLARSPGAIVGIDIRETGVGNGVIQLHDGYDISAPIIWSGRVTNGGTLFGPLAGNAGVFFSQALLLEVVQGTAASITGAVYLRGSE
jgi:hypothetical protein